MVAALVVVALARRGREGLRAALDQANHRHLAGGLRYAALSLDFWTSLAELRDLEYRATEDASAPRWTAARATARVDRLSWLRGRPAIEAAQIEGASIWLGPSARGASARAVHLSGDLRLRIDRAQQTGASVGFELTAALDLGGQLALAGTWREVEGPVDLRCELKELAIAPLLPLIPRVRQLAGSLSGELRLSGRVTQPDALTGHLRLGDAVIVSKEVELRGPVELVFEIAGEGLWLRRERRDVGHFELDATQAELDYQGFYHKPVGVSAALTGALHRGADGALEIGELHLKLIDPQAATDRQERASDFSHTLSPEAGRTPGHDEHSVRY